MKITNSELTEYVYGALTVKEHNGFLSFERLDLKQFEITDSLHPVIRNAARVNASVTLEMITDAKSVSFDCIFAEMDTEYDTLDILCNGAMVKSFDLGGITKGKVLRITAELPEGPDKHLSVYMPSDGFCEIANFEICAAYIKRVKKGERIMFIGDSITQGYGPYVTSLTYVNIFGRLGNYDIFNQGIGGYYYDERFAVPLDRPAPVRVIIAFGTNQINSADKAERVKEFYNKFVPLYPNAKITVITPIWRCDPSANIPNLLELSKAIRNTCSEYKIPVIDGFTLVPNSPKYFKDGLHPNVAGCLLYAQNLYRAIKG